MEDPKSFYEKEREKEAAYDVKAEDCEREATPTEQDGKTGGDDGYFRFEGEPPRGKKESGNASSAMATTALVFSIVAFFCCGLPFSIVGLVLSIVDRSRRGSWSSLGVAALVISILALVFSIISTVLAISMWSALLEELAAELEAEVTLGMTAPLTNAALSLLR